MRGEPTSIARKCKGLIEGQTRDLWCFSIPAKLPIYCCCSQWVGYDCAVRNNVYARSMSDVLEGIIGLPESRTISHFEMTEMQTGLVRGNL